MKWFDQLPFRMGTSSYIIPDDILPNVRWLAGKIRDVELVLFDVDEYCNIPDGECIAELNRIAAENDLSYTVHLPLDLNFSEDGAAPSIEKALKVIRGVQGLTNIHAYVCHLDSRQVKEADFSAERWQAERLKAVRQLMAEAPLGKLLSIENLENYPIEWNAPVIGESGASACVDIGHLWLQHLDAEAVLNEWIPRTRVIHLHGIGTRDHQSLKFVDPQILRGVLKKLIDLDYRGVVTLEVFNEDDFASSMEAIRKNL